MYGWIWRRLPGPWPARLGISLALIALAVFALMQWVFPAVAPYMPFNGQTVT